MERINLTDVDTDLRIMVNVDAIDTIIEHTDGCSVIISETEYEVSESFDEIEEKIRFASLSILLLVVDFCLLSIDVCCL